MGTRESRQRSLSPTDSMWSFEEPKRKSSKKKNRSRKGRSLSPFGQYPVYGSNFSLNSDCGPSEHVLTHEIRIHNNFSTNLINFKG
jgi:hypothetical protein